MKEQFIKAARLTGVIVMFALASIIEMILIIPIIIWDILLVVIGRVKLGNWRDSATTILEAFVAKSLDNLHRLIDIFEDIIDEIES